MKQTSVGDTAARVRDAAPNCGIVVPVASQPEPPTGDRIVSLRWRREDMAGFEPGRRMTLPAPGSFRPAANLPEGSAYGLAGLCILTGMIPFLVLQSLVPVFKGGADIWIGSFLPVLGATAAVATVVVAGVRHRRSWYVSSVFAYGWFVLACFAAGLGLGVALLAGILPEAVPGLCFIHVVNLVLWAIVCPLAWLLRRRLGLNYWHPWSTPDDWEPPAAPRTPQTALASRLSGK